MKGRVKKRKQSSKKDNANDSSDESNCSSSFNSQMDQVKDAVDKVRVRVLYIRQQDGHWCILLSKEMFHSMYCTNDLLVFTIFDTVKVPSSKF